ncbi:Dehydrogenase/reductase SDR family member on chromosome X [Eufriesea mexicana]|nr:Dehydrogenase/reductase SDR family member on chromosome X [Eufriesea mexicana]
MLFIGSICAIIASCFMYRNLRQMPCPIVIEQFLYEVKYTLLAAKEIIYAWISTKYNENDCLPQPGRIAIVTGGSRGIGVEVVKMLLELNMEVIIGRTLYKFKNIFSACRTPSAGEKAILQIRESGINSGQAKVYKLDNASLESVKQFATEIKKDYKQIHVLINNAGVMFGPYQETVDGFEQQWAVNYLSHFLLTSLLLPLLKAGGLPEQSSRIINITSCVQLLGKINFNDINEKNKFLTKRAYAQSKLAQEIFTKRLQDLLKKKQYYIQVYSVHPGTPKQGAISIVYTAVNKAIENCGGLYINNCRPGQVNPDALNSSIQKTLFDISLQQVQLNDFFQYV